MSRLRRNCLQKGYLINRTLKFVVAFFTIGTLSAFGLILWLVHLGRIAIRP
jgi:hypothetical protein